VTASIGVFLSAAYMLWMVQRVFYGEPQERHSGLADLNARERLVLIPACALMLLMGMFPATFLRPMDAAVSAVIERAGRTSFEARANPPETSSERLLQSRRGVK
jgi:NADH-quinone oxidoreductase subunit M